MSGLSLLLGAGLAGAATWAWLKYRKSRDASLFTEQPKLEYDYVIVGAGSAGSVLANRLSANGDVTVLVLESGRDSEGYHVTRYPALCLAAWDVDELFNIHDIGEGGYTLRVGHILGGGGSVNGMTFIRGCRQDFDNWAKLTGDATWSYSHILPYFKRTERVEEPAFYNSPYHSTHGEIGVIQEQVGTRLLEEAFNAIGVPSNADTNGATLQGFGTSWKNVSKGYRSSPSSALLRPALRDRGNLDLVLHAEVLKVVFEGSTAHGVQVRVKGRTHTIHAKREVILSAGAIGSPKLLLLSGVGPKDHLQEVGVPVMADLPVGRHLGNHASFEVPITSKEPIRTDPLRNPSTMLASLQHAVLGSGPLLDSVVWTDVFVGSTQHLRDIDWPDVQLIFLDYIPTTLNSQTTPPPDKADKPAPNTGTTCLCVATRCASEGAVTLRSADPSDPPVIHMNFLAERRDLDALLHGVEVLERLVKTPVMSRLGARIQDVWTPNGVCPGLEFGTKAFWETAARKVRSQVQHPLGTCRMGRPDDPEAVVDPQFRVRGLRNLRVVDGSAMARMVTTNPQSTIIAMAEKAADLIAGKTLLPPEDPAVFST